MIATESISEKSGMVSFDEKVINDDEEWKIFGSCKFSSHGRFETGCQGRHISNIQNWHTYANAFINGKSYLLHRVI